MAVRHPYVVHLREPGSKRSLLFHTVARSEAEALKIARSFHPGWRHIETVIEQ